MPPRNRDLFLEITMNQGRLLKKENMLEQKFATMVQMIAKPGNDILVEMSEEQAELAHMAMLITSEAGELADAIKKHVIYQKPIDMENIVEELGDLEWTMERIRQILCITRELTIDQNIEKLTKRYPNLQYSNQSAQNRADKQ